MNTIKFDYLGGFPFDQNTLLFMQESYLNIASAFVSFTGSNVILSGVLRVGNTITDGWIIYNGALLPFKGTNAATDYFTVKTLVEPVRFEDTQNKEVYFTRYAECSSSGENMARLTRLNTLQETQSNLSTLSTKHERDITQLKTDFGNDLVLQKNELVNLISEAKNALADLKKHYETNVITCYYDLDLGERTSSVSSPLYSPEGGSHNDAKLFGRYYGAMDNYVCIRCHNPDYSENVLRWTVKPFATYTNYADLVQLYAARVNDYKGEIKTRLWYVLVHKNFTSPLLGNSLTPVWDD